MKQYKWWIYTVLFGLLPFFARWLVFFITNKTDTLSILNEIDMAAFALVLVTNSINDIQEPGRLDNDWKGTCMGFSIFLLCFMAMILGISYFNDINKVSVIDQNKLKYVALGISIVAFIFSLGLTYHPQRGVISDG